MKAMLRITSACALGAGLIAAVLSGCGTTGTNSSTSAPSVDLAAQANSLQNGCRAWFSADRPQGDADWCTSMSAWISARVGQSPTSARNIWGQPNRLTASCREWMSQDQRASTSGVDGQGWCSGMVGWMVDNMNGWSGRNDWGTWMGQGPMMGGGGMGPGRYSPGSTSPSNPGSMGHGPMMGG